MALEQYPFIRNIWMISTDPHLGLADGFTSFVASDKGQRIILKAGLLPAIAPLRLVNVRKD
jgi:phosphate transport system substrate-binding protein